MNAKKTTEKYERSVGGQSARVDVSDGVVILVIGAEVYTINREHARKLGVMLKAAARCAYPNPSDNPTGHEVWLRGPIFEKATKHKKVREG